MFCCEQNNGFMRFMCPQTGFCYSLNSLPKQTLLTADVEKNTHKDTLKVLKIDETTAICHVYCKIKDSWVSAHVLCLLLLPVD